MLSESMLLAAQSQDWDRLALLAENRQTLLAPFLSGDVVLPAEVKPLIEAILEHDNAIRAKAEPWLAHTRAFLAKLSATPE